MLIMASKDNTNGALISVSSTSNSQSYVPFNQYLISALLARNVQPSENTLVVSPPSSVAATAIRVTVNTPTQDNVGIQINYRFKICYPDRPLPMALVR